MSLTSGSRLGPYEILSPIGAGGMGEVYEARDTRLDRRVAIKILPSHLSDNPRLRERFEREARAISGLNHPHICTLHDIGNENGVDFLVMEYLEGDDLAERLKKGPLPLDLALRYGIEIADALDQVHRHGVVHRDLKPGNIMLTESGAKLTDFGLAKLAGAEGVSVASSLPTQQKPLTEEGAILGTFQYMSPEQLEGKEADSRTDIFAFGTVLYEMVTGKKAFEGKSQASLISAIMSSIPRPVSELQPMSPPALDHVIKRCLEKDSGERWQSARDVMMELKWVADGGSSAEVRAPEAPPSRKWARIVSVAALLLLTVGLVASVFTRASPERLVRKVSITAPNDTLGAPVVSPDGLYVALIAEDSSGIRRLWVRALDSLAWRPLSGTEGARHFGTGNVFWSPDSRFIAFWSDGKLKRIALSGGSVQTICEAHRVDAGTWNRDGVILMWSGDYQGLRKVPASGGDTTAATTPDSSLGLVTHSFPHFLPDGEHFLYYARGKQGANGVYLGSLGSARTELLFPRTAGRASSPTFYTPPGYLLYVRDGNLMAQPFDAARAELTGEAVVVASGVAARGFSVSDTGVLVYANSTGPELSELVWFDRGGRRLQSVGEPGHYYDIELSPDGRALAAERFDPDTENDDIWQVDLSRDLHSRLTSHRGWDFLPRWSPEGDRIAFASSRSAGYGIYEIISTGGGEPELLYDAETVSWVCDWTRDGSHIAFSREGDLLALSLSGDSETLPILDSEFDENRGRFSPDGRFLAYESNETGRSEVYVTTFPEAGKRWRISAEGGEQPRWRADGKELFFVSAEGELMAATVRGGAEFGADFPEALPLAVPRGGSSRYRYDVTSIGERFLVLTPVKGAGAEPITVVFNWFEELKRLVPTN